MCHFETCFSASAINAFSRKWLLSVKLLYIKDGMRGYHYFIHQSEQIFYVFSAYPQKPRQYHQETDKLKSKQNAVLADWGIDVKSVAKIYVRLYSKNQV